MAKRLADFGEHIGIVGAVLGRRGGDLQRDDIEQRQVVRGFWRGGRTLYFRPDARDKIAGGQPAAGNRYQRLRVKVKVHQDAHGFVPFGEPQLA